jgi:hypothetical protein
MNETIVFPDAVGIIIGYLDALLDVPVVNSIPNPRPSTASFVTIRRGGGALSSLVVDAATILVEVWGPEGGDPPYPLAQLVRGRLHAMWGTVQSGVPIYRVDELGGPAELPDPDSAQPRVQFTVSVLMRGSAL